MDTINILLIARGNYLQILSDYFTNDPNYKIIGSTYNLVQAKRCTSTNPKTIVLVDYSSMDQAFFEELEATLKPDRVRIIAICDSIKEGFTLLSKGANDMCIRPKNDDLAERRTFLSSLNLKITKLIKEFNENPRTLKNKYNTGVKNIIVIGSSTGGTECILKILKNMPKDSPPILIVQHMPPVFTKLYSQRLNRECAISVWEAQDGDTIENGLALIAPGDKQMRLRFHNNRYGVTCTDEPPYSGHIPSVDVLFHSAAKVAPKLTTGVILTGMGRDGAVGLLKMKEAGSFTIGQDEKSCIVYGMPKAAYDIGAVTVQADFEKIADIIMANL